MICIDVQTTRSLNCLNDTSQFGFEPKRLSLVYIFKEHKSGHSAVPFLNLMCALPYLSRRHQNGGASQDRTDDPLLAKQVLSQLSYGPK